MRKRVGNSCCIRASTCTSASRGTTSCLVSFSALLPQLSTLEPTSTWSGKHYSTPFWDSTAKSEYNSDLQNKELKYNSHMIYYCVAFRQMNMEGHEILNDLLWAKLNVEISGRTSHHTHGVSAAALFVCLICHCCHLLSPVSLLFRSARTSCTTVTRGPVGVR